MGHKRLRDSWDAWVVPGRAPARATVQAKMNDPRMKVEIMVVAAIQNHY